jgi:hypothetical protein
MCHKHPRTAFASTWLSLARRAELSLGACVVQRPAFGFCVAFKIQILAYDIIVKRLYFHHSGTGDFAGLTW